MSTATEELNSREQAVVVIRPGETDSWGPLFLGVERAKAVVSHLDAIKAFIAHQES